MERTLIYGLIFGFIDSDLKANEIHERNIIHLIAKMCFYQDKNNHSTVFIAENLRNVDIEINF